MGIRITDPVVVGLARAYGITNEPGEKITLTATEAEKLKQVALTHVVGMSNSNIITTPEYAALSVASPWQLEKKIAAFYKYNTWNGTNGEETKRVAFKFGGTPKSNVGGLLIEYNQADPTPQDASQIRYAVMQTANHLGIKPSDDTDYLEKSLHQWLANCQAKENRLTARLDQLARLYQQQGKSPENARRLVEQRYRLTGGELRAQIKWLKQRVQYAHNMQEFVVALEDIDRGFRAINRKLSALLKQEIPSLKTRKSVPSKPTESLPSDGTLVAARRSTDSALRSK